jgi:4a-hydroxytetrahydrobiopterin dehydratase
MDPRFRGDDKRSITAKSQAKEAAVLSEKHCVPCKGGKPLPKAEAEALLRELSGWTVNRDGNWLLKDWEFKNFAQALAFVNRVGAVAEAEKHHPDIAFGWGYVHAGLQTHAVGGLHENDFILAAKIDAIN